MRFQSSVQWRLAAALLLTFLAAISAYAQTSVELREKYGEPKVIRLKNGRPEVEQYIVRPNIALKVTYTKSGQVCEMLIAPVTSTPSGGVSRTTYAPDGDLMPTDVAISIINEVAPVEKRGNKISEGTMNGGDDAMKLHHPGCMGIYWAFYQNVTISANTWCWGGTFSAVVHWGESKCSGQSLTVKQKKRSVNVVSPGSRLTVEKKG